MAPRKPAANPFGRSFLRALAGAGLGCLLVIMLGVVSGLWFLLLSPFGVVLILAAILASVVAATFARLWRRPLGWLPVVALSAVLTIGFAAVPPVLLILNNTGATGPMFG